MFWIENQFSNIDDYLVTGFSEKNNTEKRKKRPKARYDFLKNIISRSNSTNKTKYLPYYPFFVVFFHYFFPPKKDILIWFSFDPQTLDRSTVWEIKNNEEIENKNESEYWEFELQILFMSDVPQNVWHGQRDWLWEKCKTTKTNNILLLFFFPWTFWLLFLVAVIAGTQ